MVSLSDAITVTPAYNRTGVSDPLLNRYPPSNVYDCTVEKYWTIGNVAHGGYLLAILTRAATTHQRLSNSSHLDPAHLTSQFLTASAPGPAQVEVKVVSTSKRWTRLNLELWQYDKPSPDTKDFVNAHRILRITAHYLFTTLENVFELPNPKDLTPTFLDRPCPLLQHPGEFDRNDRGSKIPEKFGFKTGVKWQEVDVVEEGNELRWGCWFELTQGEDLTKCADLLPFFADCSKNGPEILGLRGKPPAPSWYPTLTFSLDFKSSFPLPASSCSSPRTFGMFASTKTIQSGRHDLTVEVWSAPCDLGRGNEKQVGKDWRKEVKLVGVSTQMALTTTMAFNMSRGNSSSSVASSASEGSGGEEEGKNKARL